MTHARQPQQEYIITADELQKLMSWSTHKSPGVCQYERRLEILRKVITDRDPTPNPCEENRCTDVENCDEICQHSRLFSPLQMQEAKQVAANAAREQVLNAVEEFLNNDDHLSLYKWEVREQLRSLRAQQE